MRAASGNPSRAYMISKELVTVLVAGISVQTSEDFPVRASPES